MKTKLSGKQLLARAKKMKKSKLPSDRDIDYSDIPEISENQIRSAKRVGPGRPPYGAVPRKPVSIKLDHGLLEELKKEAKKEKIGYQTLIHEILEEHVSQDDRAAKGR